ncbi:MAG: hypothetical protein HY391_05655 [Deltaproteobacteria bacterium]|nr:hypothetical protein [Deltaproteobacteria bacterium]
MRISLRVGRAHFIWRILAVVISFNLIFDPIMEYLAEGWATARADESDLADLGVTTGPGLFAQQNLNSEFSITEGDAINYFGKLFDGLVGRGFLEDITDDLEADLQQFEDILNGGCLTCRKPAEPAPSLGRLRVTGSLTIDKCQLDSRGNCIPPFSTTSSTFSSPDIKMSACPDYGKGTGAFRFWGNHVGGRDPNGNLLEGPLPFATEHLTFTPAPLPLKFDFYAVAPLPDPLLRPTVYPAKEALNFDNGSSFCEHPPLKNAKVGMPSYPDYSFYDLYMTMNLISPPPYIKPQMETVRICLPIDPIDWTASATPQMRAGTKEWVKIEGSRYDVAVTEGECAVDLRFETTQTQTIYKHSLCAICGGILTHACRFQGTIQGEGILNIDEDWFPPPIPEFLIPFNTAKIPVEGTCVFPLVGTVAEDSSKVFAGAFNASFESGHYTHLGGYWPEFAFLPEPKEFFYGEGYTADRKTTSDTREDYTYRFNEALTPADFSGGANGEGGPLSVEQALGQPPYLPMDSLNQLFDELENILDNYVEKAVTLAASLVTMSGRDLREKMNDPESQLSRAIQELITERRWENPVKHIAESLRDLEPKIDDLFFKVMITYGCFPRDALWPLKDEIAADFGDLSLLLNDYVPKKAQQYIEAGILPAINRTVGATDLEVVKPALDEFHQWLGEWNEKAGVALKDAETVMRALSPTYRPASPTGNFGQFLRNVWAERGVVGDVLKNLGQTMTSSTGAADWEGERSKVAEKLIDLYWQAHSRHKEIARLLEEHPLFLYGSRTLMAEYLIDQHPFAFPCYGDRQRCIGNLVTRDEEGKWGAPLAEEFLDFLRQRLDHFYEVAERMRVYAATLQGSELATIEAIQQLTKEMLIMAAFTAGFAAIAKISTSLLRFGAALVRVGQISAAVERGVAVSGAVARSAELGELFLGGSSQIVAIGRALRIGGVVIKTGEVLVGVQAAVAMIASLPETISFFEYGLEDSDIPPVERVRILTLTGMELTFLLFLAGGGARSLVGGRMVRAKKRNQPYLEGKIDVGGLKRESPVCTAPGASRSVATANEIPPRTFKISVPGRAPRRWNRGTTAVRVSPSEWQSFFKKTDPGSVFVTEFYGKYPFQFESNKFFVTEKSFSALLESLRTAPVETRVIAVQLRNVKTGETAFLGKLSHSGSWEKVGPPDTAGMTKVAYKVHNHTGIPWEHASGKGLTILDVHTHPSRAAVRERYEKIYEGLNPEARKRALAHRMRKEDRIVMENAFRLYERLEDQPGAASLERDITRAFEVIEKKKSSPEEVNAAYELLYALPSEQDFVAWAYQIEQRGLRGRPHVYKVRIDTPDGQSRKLEITIGDSFFKSPTSAAVSRPGAPSSFDPAAWLRELGVRLSQSKSQDEISVADAIAILGARGGIEVGGAGRPYLKARKAIERTYGTSLTAEELASVLRYTEELANEGMTRHFEAMQSREAGTLNEAKTTAEFLKLADKIGQQYGEQYAAMVWRYWVNKLGLSFLGIRK